MIVPISQHCRTLERGLPSTEKEAEMVASVTYRVRVEVELGERFAYFGSLGAGDLVLHECS